MNWKVTVFGTGETTDAAPDWWVQARKGNVCKQESMQMLQEGNHHQVGTNYIHKMLAMAGKIRNTKAANNCSAATQIEVSDLFQDLELLET